MIHTLWKYNTKEFKAEAYCAIIGQGIFIPEKAEVKAVCSNVSGYHIKMWWSCLDNVIAVSLVVSDQSCVVRWGSCIWSIY